VRSLQHSTRKLHQEFSAALTPLPAGRLPHHPYNAGSRRVEAPQGRAAVSMVTSHQQPNPRVGRPSRESNPVHGVSQGPADIQSQGAIEERSLNTANPLVFCSQSGTGNIVRRGLRAPSARQGLCLILLAPEMVKCPLSLAGLRRHESVSSPSSTTSI